MSGDRGESGGTTRYPDGQSQDETKSLLWCEAWEEWCQVERAHSDRDVAARCRCLCGSNCYCPSSPALSSGIPDAFRKRHGQLTNLSSKVQWLWAIMLQNLPNEYLLINFLNSFIQRQTMMFTKFQKKRASTSWRLWRAQQKTIYTVSHQYDG